MITETIAQTLITDSLAAHGRVTIQCECGAYVTYLDHDYNNDDVARVATLIEHAAYGHASPRSILAVVYTEVLNTESLPTN